jgi:hypothetical protein
MKLGNEVELKFIGKLNNKLEYDTQFCIFFPDWVSLKEKNQNYIDEEMFKFDLIVNLINNK